MNTKSRVLLVDDDPKFRAAMVCALKEIDCLVTQAPTLAEAEVEIKAGNFDLIVLDGDLPDGNGVTWLRMLRKQGVTSPAVFVSATVRDSLSFMELRKFLGVSLVLHKPVSIEVFKAEIGHLFHNAVKPSGDAQREASQDLCALAAEYLTELPGRLQNLTALLRKAAVRPHDCQFVKAAAREAHMLRGTAGLFGLAEVGHSMGWIEDTLQTMMTNKLVLHRPESWTAIQGALVEANEHAHQPSMAWAKESVIQASGANFASASSRTGRLRVLLLDDDRTFTRRAEAILSAEGILVYSFLDADHFRDLLDEICPDLLLLDLNMPGLSGLEICRLIRRERQWKDLPILFVSGTDNVESQIAAMDAGSNGYLTKSSVNVKLLNAVKSHILSMPKAPTPGLEYEQLPRFEMPLRSANVS